MIGICYEVNYIDSLLTIKDAVKKLHFFLEDTGEMTSSMWNRFNDIENNLDCIEKTLKAVFDE